LFQPPPPTNQGPLNLSDIVDAVQGASESAPPEKSTLSSLAQARDAYSTASRHGIIVVGGSVGAEALAPSRDSTLSSLAQAWDSLSSLAQARDAYPTASWQGINVVGG